MTLIAKKNLMVFMLCALAIKLNAATGPELKNTALNASSSSEICNAPEIPVAPLCPGALIEDSENTEEDEKRAKIRMEQLNNKLDVEEKYYALARESLRSHWWRRVAWNLAWKTGVFTLGTGIVYLSPSVASRLTLGTRFSMGLAAQGRGLPLQTQFLELKN